VFFVPGIRSNRNQDPRAELLDQLTQEFRVAVVKPLDVDWINDRSAPSSVGCRGLPPPPRSHVVFSVRLERTGTKDKPKCRRVRGSNWKS